ncbi:MAG: hypothetical protein M1816_002760 [Peltula sp. TS41687]|nr:MAG: hypothetical protein M1816_002760 [Peltula sp. TS41687]
MSFIFTPRQAKAVTFRLQPDVKSIERIPFPPNRRPPKSRLKMSVILFEKYDGDQVTDSMLQEASKLFGENYGVWDKEAARVMGGFAREGSRVKMSPARLRDQCLPQGAANTYVRVIVDNHLAGNAFACRWMYHNRSVCWITQLVVHREYRERGLAAGLLNALKQDTDEIYGLVSSHAAACLAAAKSLGDPLNANQLRFIRDHAEGIMKASPVTYVTNAKLRGSLFDTSQDHNGMISSVDTGFFVDHTEPLEALAWVQENTDWPLGKLLDGHEFLLIMEAKRRARSRSRSAIVSSPSST